MKLSVLHVTETTIVSNHASLFAAKLYPFTCDGALVLNVFGLISPMIYGLLECRLKENGFATRIVSRYTPADNFQTNFLWSS